MNGCAVPRRDCVTEAQSEPRWSTFLEDFHRVDFRMRAPDPMVSLVYGITGERLEL